ncbi:GntR family transcriptional regulator [Vagococcus acidifermentans]|uniref:HTH gntR-type domain-containing protein n=1 Tax=Vagococcus acidifermentans TaxID=564710 RepID=A0A430APB8_9ENTE|nr:GntR family transcriptional regulator [Vagococcus acidifermentans]RSU09915.1 hypothetical protein CBF27_11485 [Vagococcus acidifermentans]
MYIRIEPESKTPIYTQLIYQIKTGILRKELLPGETLPSVRSLARDIGINMHTVNKAYKRLQEEGVLIQDKKAFLVNPSQQIDVPDEVNRDFEERFEELLIDAKIFRMTNDTMEQLKEKIEVRLKKGES